VNTTTGAIMLYEAVHNPGTLTWQALYRNGTFGVIAKTATTCPAFQSSRNGHCSPDWLAFGQGSSAVIAAGTVPVAISPVASARALLRQARREHHAGVPLAIVVTFQSAYGGPSVTHIVTVLATVHSHGASASRATTKH